MQVKDSKGHKVWNVESKGNITILRIGDSRKKADGNWDNFYWSAICVGEANKQAQDLEKGDKITIKSGQAYMEEYQGKHYNKVTVFSLEIDSKDQQQSQEEYIPPFRDEDNPF